LCRFVQTSFGAAADKPAGVVALTCFDLRRLGKVKGLAARQTNSNAERSKSASLEQAQYNTMQKSLGLGAVSCSCSWACSPIVLDCPQQLLGELACKETLCRHLTAVVLLAAARKLPAVLPTRAVA
jgi:hypothetical protein